MQTELEQRLRRCSTLPTLPGVALRVLDLGNDPDTSLGEVAETITCDPALASKLLKAANSPLYGQRRKTENLRQALSLVGLNAALTLALSFSLRGAVSADRTQVDMQHYWRRSLIAAEACRLLGTQQGLHCREELFLAGLLHDIGMLALERALPEAYGPLLAGCPSHDALVLAEHDAFGVDHAAVGAWLLKHWGLPDYLVQAVAGSHQPNAASAPMRGTVLAPYTAVASCMAELWFQPESEAMRAAAWTAAAQWLHLSQADYQEVLESMAATLPEVAHLFEITLPDTSQITGLLEQAQELLTVRTLLQAQEATAARSRAEALEAKAQDLEHQSQRDGLTGLYNRRFFNARLAEEFANAQRHGWPLAVALIDLDHFKQVNDRHGHQAGDTVLLNVARLFMAKLRDTDVVARYGGEEFIVLLPGTAIPGAEIVLDRILDALRATPHPVGGTAPLTVTASIGLAVGKGRTLFTEPAALVEAADQALYAAKHGGRDRRVTYRPRVG